MLNKVCVLIRVYNRIEDLKYCIDIIKDTWKNNDFYIIVVSNGKKDGYIIDVNTVEKIDLLIEIENNIGHFNGNSQLLKAGLEHIPNDCNYTVILEADTWVYGDELITKYIKRMAVESAVWASAQFFRYVVNLATDFAIIKTAFIKSHPEVFSFSLTPEYYIGEYLYKNKYKYIYIKENMPVNLPKYIKKYPYAPTGRFFVFPKSKMVTHHIESLKNGMDEKKDHFNVLSNTNYFKIRNETSMFLMRIKMNVAITLSSLIPYKSWFVKSPKFYK
ncbi:MAG: glycosyltransferase [Janthinobacterium lividum]